ncbi:MAG: 50S ribosomal protein L28 [Patescibacteria group bacterium]
MAYQCELCGKKSAAGRQHTHHAGVAGGQWKKRAQTTRRRFKPNLHWVTLPTAGVMKRVRACTKCIKRVRFDINKLTKQQINKVTVSATIFLV